MVKNEARPPDVESQLTGKDCDAGKNWGQETPAAENEMVRWLHWINRHEFEQTPGDSEEQGSLVCCSPLGHRVGYNLATEQQQQIVKKHLKCTNLVMAAVEFVSHFHYYI